MSSLVGEPRWSGVFLGWKLNPGANWNLHAYYVVAVSEFAGKCLHWNVRALDTKVHVQTVQRIIPIVPEPGEPLFTFLLREVGLVQRGTCGHRDSIGFGARYLARRRRSRKEIRDNSGQDPLESLEVDAPRAAEPQAPTAPEAAPDVTEGNLLARLPPINWMDPLPLLVPALSLDLIVLNLEVLRGEISGCFSIHR